ncbi:MAG: ATP-binding cassette domain-containing protein [Candidatus Omnitrophica bacterium]|nr:ATP-binding cassette domain-containing protein [Candidatus Omnitrophota bacterium]
MLSLENLAVAVEGTTILKEINLKISAGEVVILFGPNGSGKSTLLKAILGLSGYETARGNILFRGEPLNSLPTEERVRKGIGMMFQHPPTIRGVRLHQLARYLEKDTRVIERLSEKLSLSAHLQRDLNAGFSGGEMKRSELFQLMLQEPDLLLLDEPESGVDMENISLMGKVLGEYLRRENKAALIITHTGYILEHIRADRGCVLHSGEFGCMGNPKKIFETIRTSGYEKCKECHVQGRPE